MPRKYEVKCTQCHSDLNREWLKVLKQILHPCVRGAIRDTIRVHGPISKEEDIGSAAKRIVGALLTRFYELDSGLGRAKLSIQKLDEPVVPDIDCYEENNICDNS